MSDGAPVDGSLPLSGYEAKLVVAALCRYARAGDVHAAHRDRCERLASALAGESSVTLTLSGAPGADGDPGGGEPGRTGVGATAGRPTRDGSGVGETAAAEVASDPGWVVSDAGVGPTDAAGPRPAAGEVAADGDWSTPTASESRTDADGSDSGAPDRVPSTDGAGSEAPERRLPADGARREAADVASETAGEAAFRWGPDCADG